MSRYKLYGKRELTFVGLIAGVALLIAGIVISLNGWSDKTGGILLGIGSGLIGASVTGLVSVMLEKNDPAAVRQKKIDVNDERNITLRDKAGARTNTIIMTLVVLAALTLTLIGVELYVTLTMFGLVLVNAILYVVNFNYFNKKL